MVLYLRFLIFFLAQSSGASTALADAMVANAVIPSASDMSVTVVKTKVLVVLPAKPLEKDRTSRQS
jgi:hypothetical protein